MNSSNQNTLEPIRVQEINQHLNNSTHFLRQSDLYQNKQSNNIPIRIIHSTSRTYYDHKSTLSNKSTGFGYGHKTDFTKLFTKTPAPGTYHNVK